MPQYADITEGAPLPRLSVTVTPTQLFYFSAATYNAHRIHHDRHWAVDVENYPDLVIHGPLQAAILTRAILDWAGPAARLQRLTFQHRAPAHAGDTLHCTGTVTTKRLTAGRPTVDLTLRLTNSHSHLLLPATATLTLP